MVLFFIYFYDMRLKRNLKHDYSLEPNIKQYIKRKSNFYLFSLPNIALTLAFSREKFFEISVILDIITNKK